MKSTSKKQCKYSMIDYAKMKKGSELSMKESAPVCSDFPINYQGSMGEKGILLKGC
jgi:hypothetical protein